MILGTIAVVAIAALVAWGLYSFFNGNETYVSGGNEGESVSALDCKATAVSNPFFVSNTAQSVTHEIKVTFADGKANKLSYNYYGTYETPALAETANATLHADYNIYMGENGLSAERLYPTFVAVDNTVKINLFAEKGKLDVPTGKIFFLKADEAVDFFTYSSTVVSKIYNVQGFNCVYGE